MAKTITLTYEGAKYTLEYNKDSVREMERGGFKTSDIGDKPATALPTLFAGAFIKNHRGVKRRVVDEMFDKIPDKMSFMEALSEMYNEPLEALLEDPEGDEGNAEWVKGW